MKVEEINDKEFELAVGYQGVTGSMKFKNYNNRVMASIEDIIIDSLSYFRWKNTVRFLDKYNAKKQKRNLLGKETPLPPKFIIEILDNALQEDNDELQEQWSNILINWQDLEKNCDKKYMYLELLKNLGLNEIRLLKLISKTDDYKINAKTKNAFYDGKYFKSCLGLSDDEYELMILNLYRLKICDSFKSPGGVIMIGDMPVLADAGINRFKLTIIGANLIDSIKD